MTDEKSPKDNDTTDLPEGSPETEADQPTSPEPEDEVEQPASMEPDEEASPSSEEFSRILKKLEEAEERAEAMQDRSLRAVAELDNYRKRMARERMENAKTAAAEVIESLLPALDNLKIGLSSVKDHENTKDLAQGFEMVGKQIISALEEHGLREMDPEGETFDPHFHDSLSTQPSDGIEEGKVMKTVKAGYMLNDKMLRPASVIVSSGPEKREEDRGKPEEKNQEPGEEKEVEPDSDSPDRKKKSQAKADQD